MTRRHRKPAGSLLERVSTASTRWTGRSSAFGLALAVIVAWALSGPFFGFSDTWQLVINTGTTVVTFLMVFLIQRAQNKESEAIQLKLNEIVAALEGASNRLVNVESLPESELSVLHRHFLELARLAAHDSSMTRSHTIEEAQTRHKDKRRRTAKESPA